MNLENLCVGLGIGLLIMLIIVSVISLLFYFVSLKRRKKIKNTYLSKFTNTDFSIDRTVKYLKLTNGIQDERAI